VLAVEFFGADVVLTIDLPGDQAPITVRQTSVNPPVVNAKVRIDVLGVVVAFGSEQ
jgi:iron(III) transport system ATP-binding protein